MLNGLCHRVFKPKLSYYSGHYRKQEDGSFAAYALEPSYYKLMKYEWEVYGLEDYYSDFYHPGMTICEMKDNIRNSDEKEIGFSFRFDFDVDGITMYEFVKLLRREGFYYWCRGLIVSFVLIVPAGRQ